MNKKLPILLAILALIVSSLACKALSGGEPTLSNIRTATDADGANPTSTFSSTDTIYAVSDLKNGVKGNVVSSSWYAVDVVGVDPNFLIDSVDYKVEEDTFTGIVHFYFEPPTDGWPAGKYRVDISFNGVATGSAEYTIK